MATPYRAEHIGSLLRPPELRAARAAHRDGRLRAEALRQAEDAAILRALELQRQVGVDVYTDGEYRRGAFTEDFAASVEGFTAVAVAQRWHGPEGEYEAPASSAVVGARLRQTRRLTADQVAFLQQHAPGPFKMTLPSPAYFWRVGFQPGVTDPHYASREELRADVVGILRREVQALVAEGVLYVQVDASRYGHYVDEGLREGMRQRFGVDADRLLQEDIAAENAVLAGVARGTTLLAIHVCRGNRQSSWLAAGGYERIAEPLFQGLQHDRFLLEYDTARAGGFEPLRFVPRDKTVVLGLVTTKTGALERKDDLLRRIEEAARYVPIERLALSPQCGFASGEAGNRLSWDDQRRKLELVVETARTVWG
jgi:5-methyltetrahydropteroyltriglutamate--homocysteine methyltransferase